MRILNSLCILMCFALEINDEAPMGGSPQPLAADGPTEATTEPSDLEGEDDATTGINATEHDDATPVQAEPGTDVTEQQAGADDSE